jgi:hypothetical protein
MGAAEFVRQLRELGHEVDEPVETRVTLPYTIPIGRRLGETIRLGFDVPPDFPNTPPSGPRVSPRLGHPAGAVHAATDFGSEWEYWSRPFPNWQGTDRSVKTYMAHVRRLLQQL